MARRSTRNSKQLSELPAELVAADALAAIRWNLELWMLGFLCLLYWLVYALDDAEAYRAMNVVGPVVLATILGWACYRMVRKCPLTVWASLFWFRLACAVYYGVGALVPHIANQETREFMYALYSFDDELNFKVNVVYTTGIYILLQVSYFLLRGVRSKIGSHTHELNIRTLRFAVGFLVVCGVLRYGVDLPYSIGLTRTTVSGSLLTLAKGYYVGLYLMIYYSLRCNRGLLYIVWCLIAFDAAVSIATFAKIELLLLLIFSYLGFVSQRPSLAKTVAGALFVLVAYFMFQPLVGYGRTEVQTRYGSEGAGIVQRWEIIQAYLSGGREAIDVENQSGLARLSYVNVAAFVIDRYDFGAPGNTLRDAAAIFIPRQLWPDKPIITQLGTDLNVLVFGKDTSSLGVGHFAEAYWNYGWVGLPPFMAIVALILSIFTRCGLIIMARKDWLLLPVVFLGVNVGFRVDGHVVPDVLGPAWIALVLGIGLLLGRSMFEQFLRRRASTVRW